MSTGRIRRPFRILVFVEVLTMGTVLTVLRGEEGGGS